MLLAIDSATRKIGVALYDGAQVLHESVWHSKNQHSVELAPAIELAISKAGYKIGDIQAIAVSLGPGSYTGLRIGMAVAKGIALTKNLPLIGVSTFDILAQAQTLEPEKQLAIVLEAGRKRLSVGWYKVIDGAWKKFQDPDLLTPQELSQKINAPTLICGEILTETQRVLTRKWKNVTLVSPAFSLRRPSFLAEIAWKRWKAGEVDDAATLDPFYMQTDTNYNS
jgi:tRNA threonylcarbamoyladenosine biosynthesis protein TsaB